MGTSRRKDAAPASAPMFGAAVFASDLIEALLRYGTHDRLMLIGAISADDRAWLENIVPGGVSRTQFVERPDLDRLRNVGDAILLSSQVVTVPELRIIRRVFAGDHRWPIVSFIHSVNAYTVPFWFTQQLLGDLQPWDAVVCSSTAGRRVLDKFLLAAGDVYPQLAATLPAAGLRCPVIPLGTSDPQLTPEDRIAARQALGVTDDTAVILYMGRLSPVLKCDLVPLLIAYAAMVGDGGRRTRLVIAGDDTTHRAAPALADVARDLGCADQVILKPNVTSAERRALYAGADIFTSPSDNLQETFGLAVIEAMAARLPVVISDWNGYRDLVTEGETGFLVPTASSDLGGRIGELVALSPPEHDGTLAGATVVDIHRLRHSLQLLVDDRERRVAMGARAYAAFRSRFEWRVIVAQYEQLWRDLQALARDTAMTSGGPRRDVILPDAFAHYPTRQIADTDIVAFGPMGPQVERALEWASRMPVPRVGSPQMAQMTAGIVQTRQRVSIGELVEALVATSKVSEIETRLAIFRLLKYGVLSLVTHAGTPWPVTAARPDHVDAAMPRS